MVKRVIQIGGKQECLMLSNDCRRRWIGYKHYSRKAAIAGLADKSIGSSLDVFIICLNGKSQPKLREFAQHLVNSGKLVIAIISGELPKHYPCPVYIQDMDNEGAILEAIGIEV